MTHQGVEHDTRTPISEGLAKHIAMYGEGSRDPLRDIELGWQVYDWLEFIDDVEQLEELALEYRITESQGYVSDQPLKDMHWRDTEFMAGGFLEGYDPDERRGR